MAAARAEVRPRPLRSAVANVDGWGNRWVKPSACRPGTGVPCHSTNRVVIVTPALCAGYIRTRPRSCPDATGTSNSPTSRMSPQVSRRRRGEPGRRFHRGRLQVADRPQPAAHRGLPPGSWQLLEPILSPSFSYLDGATGEVSDQKRYIEDLRRIPLPTIGIDQVVVHVDGDVAVVSARSFTMPEKFNRYIDTDSGCFHRPGKMTDRLPHSAASSTRRRH